MLYLEVPEAYHEKWIWFQTYDSLLLYYKWTLLDVLFYPPDEQTEKQLLVGLFRSRVCERGVPYVILERIYASLPRCWPRTQRAVRRFLSKLATAKKWKTMLKRCMPQSRFHEYYTRAKRFEFSLEGPDWEFFKRYGGDRNKPPTASICTTHRHSDTDQLPRHCNFRNEGETDGWATLLIFTIRVDADHRLAGIEFFEELVMFGDLLQRLPRYRGGWGWGAWDVPGLPRRPEYMQHVGSPEYIPDPWECRENEGNPDFASK